MNTHIPLKNYSKEEEEKNNCMETYFIVTMKIYSKSKFFLINKIKEQRKYKETYKNENATFFEYYNKTKDTVIYCIVLKNTIIFVSNDLIYARNLLLNLIAKFNKLIKFRITEEISCDLLDRENIDSFYDFYSNFKYILENYGIIAKAE
ncbi:MAG: hypothetical protein HQK79_21150 [Desulfobacterales bacterium]|nr:hypothetical protein [Desulfobacterales bacterium]